MKLYELTYILSPDLSLQDARNVFQELITFLQEKGGILENSFSPILKKLAYPVKVVKDFGERRKEKKITGYLSSLSFRLEPNQLKDVREKIAQCPGLLRFLIFAKKEQRPLLEKRTVVGYGRKLKEKPEKKVALEEIEQKLDEILGD